MAKTRTRWHHRDNTVSCGSPRWKYRTMEWQEGAAGWDGRKLRESSRPCLMHRSRPICQHTDTEGPRSQHPCAPRSHQAGPPSAGQAGRAPLMPEPSAQRDQASAACPVPLSAISPHLPEPLVNTTAHHSSSRLGALTKSGEEKWLLYWFRSQTRVTGGKMKNAICSETVSLKATIHFFFNEHVWKRNCLDHTPLRLTRGSLKGILIAEWLIN